MRTLYIDRDPITFRDIARHLQGVYLPIEVLGLGKRVGNNNCGAGYHVSPRDGQHFVRLFADAQFYSRKCSSKSYLIEGND